MHAFENHFTLPLPDQQLLSFMPYNPIYQIFHSNGRLIVIDRRGNLICDLSDSTRKLYKNGDASSERVWTIIGHLVQNGINGYIKKVLVFAHLIFVLVHSGELYFIKRLKWFRLFKTKRIVDIYSGYKHVIALSSKNVAYCYGNNKYEQLGYPHHEMQCSPIFKKLRSLSNRVCVRKIYAYENTSVCFSDTPSRGKELWKFGQKYFDNKFEYFLNLVHKRDHERVRKLQHFNHEPEKMQICNNDKNPMDIAKIYFKGQRCFIIDSTGSFYKISLSKYSSDESFHLDPVYYPYFKYPVSGIVKMSFNFYGLMFLVHQNHSEYLICDRPNTENILMIPEIVSNIQPHSPIVQYVEADNFGKNNYLLAINSQGRVFHHIDTTEVKSLDKIDYYTLNVWNLDKTEKLGETYFIDEPSLNKNLLIATQYDRFISTSTLI